MPCLRFLSLSTPEVIDIGLANGANLTRLFLDLRRASIQYDVRRPDGRVRSLLDSCPRLQHVSIHGWRDLKLPDLEDTGAVLLDHLVYLSLSYIQNIPAVATLRMIEAPNMSTSVLGDVGTPYCPDPTKEAHTDCCMTKNWNLRREIHEKVGDLYSKDFP